MAKLPKEYTVNMVAKLDRATRNGIRAAYYSNVSVKNDKNKIDKSIKEDKLTTAQLVTMLKAIGCVVKGNTATTKTTDSTKDEALKKREAALLNRESALKNREEKLSDRENALKNKEENLTDRENKLKNREERLAIRENVLASQETKIAEREKEISEKENALNEKIKLLSGGEKEYDERITILLQNESYLNQKKADLEEKGNIIQRKESELNLLKKEYDERESELNQREKALKNNTPHVDSDSIEEKVLSPLEEVERSQQVTGIELCQSERTRILSDDPERSRLIEEAGKEICNKWLCTKGSLLKENGKTTEKLIYRFVQDFVKTNFPYCGQAVYDLVLYDLQKRREEMNGTNSKE